MAQVYGAGGKTVPKQGRIGTGSYWPQGTPPYLAYGNVFPGIHVVHPDFTQVMFGERSRAGIATRDSTVNNKAIHPNAAQYNTITQPYCPGMAVSSSNESNNLQPVSYQKESLAMPHERNTNSASGTKKKPVVFRTAFGASESMPTDTAFKHNPNANYKHTTRQRPNSAVEAVKKSASARSFARPINPLPVSGGVNPRQQHRTPPASFVSRGNMWFDPNNSFIAGQQTTAGDGQGRWSVIKRGVV